MSNGDEIFGKDGLHLKSLKKLDKRELDSMIEMNIQTVVNYYYEDLYRKDERAFRGKMTDLVLNKKLFLKPVMRIFKENPDAIPTGLAFMLYDNLNQGNIHTNIEVAKLRDNQQLSKEDIDARIQELNAFYSEVRNNVLEVMEALTKKTAKKLKKMGMKKEYAILLAPAIISADYLTVKNCFRFIRTLTNAFYAVFNASLVKQEDGKMVSELGIDLTDPENIAKIMSLVTKNMDLGVYAEFIKQILLEKRDRQLDSLSKAQLNVYAAITVYAENTLEDKEVFNGKTRQQIIKSFLAQRERDEKNNRDAARRVSFEHLSEDMYPRIRKAFNRVVGKDDSEDEKED